MARQYIKVAHAWCICILHTLLSIFRYQAKSFLSSPFLQELNKRAAWIAGSQEGAGEAASLLLH